jgi:amidase
VKTLTELREFNLANQRATRSSTGRRNLDVSDEMDLERDRARYEADRAKDLALAARTGIDAAMRRTSSTRCCSPAHRRGHCRQAGLSDGDRAVRAVPNAPTPPLPEGFDAKPSPYGVSFTGMACSEPRLIELAYAFEQRDAGCRHRRRRRSHHHRSHRRRRRRDGHRRHRRIHLHGVPWDALR